MINQLKSLKCVLSQVIDRSKKKPREPNHLFFQDDVFLAEFPKSGVTWLSTILAHLEAFKQEESGVSFSSLLSYVSEEGFSSALSSNKSSNLRGRLIKTHSLWQPWHQRAIYLYRDPAKALSSLYRMYVAYGWISDKTDPVEFCIQDDRGLNHWRSHINSWIFESSASATICFVCYDEMISNTVKTLERILNFFDAEVDRVLLEKAILASSRQNMQSLESKIINSDLRFRVRFNDGYRFVGESTLRNNDIYELISKDVYKLAENEIKILKMAP